MKVRTVQEMHH